MRLIDADALRGPLMAFDSKVLEIVDNAPTIDAVRVVRCKECKHSVHYESFRMRWCWRRGAEVNDDNFCSDGERKDNETD